MSTYLSKDAEPKPKPKWDAACNGTGVLLIDIEEWSDEEDEGCAVVRNRTVVQRCDECATFDTDEEAAQFLQKLIYTHDICEKLDLFREEK